MNQKFTLFLIIQIFGAICAPIADKVTSLPDFAPFPYNFYSGYLDLPGTTKSIHYIFEESQQNPITDPIVLWLQGGPGCSGLSGWATEMGSYTNFQVDKFTPNQFAWNKISNMLYFEAPVGVGFSYATSAADQQTGDEQAAADNLASLIQFFEKFPEYKNHEFYITGESYGGIYVPTLAYQIVQYNKNASQKINLKGIAVGNGVTDWNYDTNNATMEMLVTHAFVSKRDQVVWQQNGCQQKVPYGNNGNKNQYKSASMRRIMNVIEQNDICSNLIQKFNTLTNGFNIYNLYYECNGNPTVITQSQYFKLKAFQTINPFVQNLPCDQTDFITNYFNREDVKTALHIRQQSTNQWGECANIPYIINYNGSIWTYPDLIKAGLRIWIYSGDVDGIVPYPGTLNWIYYDLNLKVTREWYQWNYWGKPAGFSEEYEGLTFATVNGAGHMVPMYRPAQAFKLFQYFLYGRPLD